MKKILQITFESPSSFSGGGLGILQSAKALLATGEVTYCGPQIADNQKNLEKEYKNILYLSKDSLKGKLLALIKGIPNTFYMSWEHTKDHINIEQYDTVYIDFSRHGHIVKWAKKHCKNVCVRLHNIEKDYYLSAFKNRPSLLGFIKYLMIIGQERKTIKYADTLLFITYEDMMRAKTIYGKSLQNKNLQIMPICLKENENNNQKIKIDSPYLLITGSLWYEQNNKGIVWFLENVWDKVSPSYADLKLLIAGRNATPMLKSEIDKRSSVILVDSPEDMAPIFNGASLYIAPVFDGAGMKVKVAEALSYGLPVIGTSHAFIGYEKDNCCIVADSDKEIYNAINNYLALTEEEQKNLKEKALELYKTNYSYKNAIRILEKIV